MLKTALVALTFTLAPLAGIAAGCDHDRAAASCAAGMTWDAEKAACVPLVSS